MGLSPRVVMQPVPKLLLAIFLLLLMAIFLLLLIISASLSISIASGALMLRTCCLAYLSVCVSVFLESVLWQNVGLDPDAGRRQNYRQLSFLHCFNGNIGG